MPTRPSPPPNSWSTLLGAVSGRVYEPRKSAGFQRQTPMIDSRPSGVGGAGARRRRCGGGDASGRRRGRPRAFGYRGTLRCATASAAARRGRRAPTRARRSGARESRTSSQQIRSSSSHGWKRSELPAPTSSTSPSWSWPALRYAAECSWRMPGSRSPANGGTRGRCQLPIATTTLSASKRRVARGRPRSRSRSVTRGPRACPSSPAARSGPHTPRGSRPSRPSGIGVALERGTAFRPGIVAGGREQAQGVPPLRQASPIRSHASRITNGSPRRRAGTRPSGPAWPPPTTIVSTRSVRWRPPESGARTTLRTRAGARYREFSPRHRRDALGSRSNAGRGRAVSSPEPERRAVRSHPHCGQAS